MIILKVREPKQNQIQNLVTNNKCKPKKINKFKKLKIRYEK